MYIVHIFTNSSSWQAIVVTFTSQTELLDFISLLHLSRNNDISIKVSYGGTSNDEA